MCRNHGSTDRKCYPRSETYNSAKSCPKTQARGRSAHARCWTMAHREHSKATPAVFVAEKVCEKGKRSVGSAVSFGAAWWRNFITWRVRRTKGAPDNGHPMYARQDDYARDHCQIHGPTANKLAELWTEHAVEWGALVPHAPKGNFDEKLLDELLEMTRPLIVRGGTPLAFVERDVPEALKCLAIKDNMAAATSRVASAKQQQNLLEAMRPHRKCVWMCSEPNIDIYVVYIVEEGDLDKLYRDRESFQATEPRILMTMTVSVDASQPVPYQYHMGIHRSLHYFTEKKRLGPGAKGIKGQGMGGKGNARVRLSMQLHSFAAHMLDNDAAIATPRLMMSDPIGSMLTILQDEKVGPVFTDATELSGGGLEIFNPKTERLKTRMRLHGANKLHAAWPREITIKRDEHSVRARPRPVTPRRNVSRSFARAGESLPHSAVQHDRAGDQRVRSCAVDSAAVRTHPSWLAVRIACWTARCLRVRDCDGRRTLGTSTAHRLTQIVGKSSSHRQYGHLC